MRRNMWFVFAVCVMLIGTGIFALDWSCTYYGPDGFQYVACFNEGVAAVISGSDIFVTPNYGETLIAATISGPHDDWVDICAVNDNIGYALSEHYLARTTDSGINWESHRITTDNACEGFHFFDTSHGIVIGGYIIMITTDAGETWDTVSTSLWGYDVHFNDAGNNGVYVSPSAVKVGFSTDSGYSWTDATNNPPTFHENYIYITNDNVIWVAGDDLERSDDFGTIWDTYITGGLMTFRVICFYNNDTGYAAGGDVIYETTDGGYSWSLDHSPSGVIRDLDVWDSGNALAVLSMASSGRIYFGDNHVFVQESKTGKPKCISLSISPNPFNSSVAISAPSGATIEIYDLNGKCVGAFDKTPCVWTPDESITSGVYLIRATKGGEIITKRAVLMK